MGGKTSKRVQERFCELPEDSSFRSAGCSCLPVDSPTELSKFFRIRPFNSKIYKLGQEGRYFFSLNRYLFVSEKPA